MRILLANKYVKVTGGADLHCLELAQGLRERGHHVAFLSTYHVDNLDQDGIFVGLNVTSTTRRDVTGRKAVQIAMRAMWNRSAAAATEELLSTFRPDIVHAHKLYPQLSVAPLVVASRRHVPIIQTVHDYEFVSASAIDDTGRWRDHDETHPTYRLLNSMLFAVKRWCHVPRVDKWISVSRSTNEVYRSRHISTTVLPNFTKPFDGKSHKFDDRNGILYIGRLSEEKGLHDIVNLPCLLDAGLPIIVAGHGPLTDDVRRAAAKFPNLTFLGPLDRSAVAQQLASARIVIMPSLWREPGPLSALEAMAAGTPLVAYDNGGLSEYVQDAKAGLVVQPFAEMLARAITSLYHDRETWEQFSSAALEAAARDHTLSGYLDRLERVYLDTVM